jgi:Fe-S-cluster containining protein
MDSSTLEGISLYQRQSVSRIFSESHSTKEAVRLTVLDAHEWFDQLRQKFRTVQNIACKEGCAWCCRQRVSITPAEVFLIAWFIEENLSAGLQRNRVMMDTALRWQVEDRLDSPSRFATGVPCPFLDEESKLCLIHAVRPFSCRWYESMDETACKIPALENSSDLIIPHDPRVQTLAGAVEQGVLLGLGDQGLSGGLLVMTGALTDFWNTEKSFEIWTEGGRPFIKSQV